MVPGGGVGAFGRDDKRWGATDFEFSAEEDCAPFEDTKHFKPSSDIWVFNTGGRPEAPPASSSSSEESGSACKKKYFFKSNLNKQSYLHCYFFIYFERANKFLFSVWVNCHC